MESEKDLGVTIDHNLNFDSHICSKVKKANQMFAMIRRSFKHLDIPTFVPMYKSLVRTHLDYAASVYHPYKKKHIDQLESVQRRATKQIPGMKELSYPERLRKLKLPTISYRRVRGDMIELYKIINKIYDDSVTSFIEMWSDKAIRSSSRTHDKKLFPQHAKSLLRQNSFKVRTANTWNSLPEYIVNAPSLNSFKNRLDKLWQTQDLMYDDHKAPLASSTTGNRKRLEKTDRDSGGEAS